MRASRSLISLLVFFPALAPTSSPAGVELLTPCNPLAVSPPPSVAHAAPSAARAVLDSLFGTRVGPAARAARASNTGATGGGTWERVTNGPGPGGYYFPAAYDPIQQQSIVLGGYAVGYAQYSWYPRESRELWSLGRDQQPQWTQVLPSAGSPYYTGQSMVVDTRADRLIVFSGISREDGSLGGLSQLSLLNPQQWTPIVADGIPPLVREFHSAVYDPLRARMVVFGGRQYGRVLADTWTLSLGGTPRWTRTDSVAAAPPPRYGQNAIYDPVGDRMIVFGGSPGTGYYGDLWQLSLAGTPAWTPLPAGAGPSLRIYSSMVYDSRRQRIVLMCGRAPDGTPLSDVWFLPLAPGAVWIPADSSSFPPGPRWGAAVTYDSDRDAVLLAAGVSNPCGFGYYGDAWMLQSTDPVPAVVVPHLETTNPGDVRLTCASLPPSGFTGAVQRRTEASGWSDLARVTPDGAGRLDFVDRSAQPGTRYDYRLQWSAGAVASTSAEQWVDVPRLSFTIASTSASPSVDGVSVAFSLPDAEPAQIALYDLAGRKLVEREVGPMGAGDHVLVLEPRGALRPGVYLVRIRRGGESVTTRASVLR